jgi:hypothetical protein
MFYKQTPTSDLCAVKNLNSPQIIVKVVYFKKSPFVILYVLPSMKMVHQSPSLVK